MKRLKRYLSFVLIAALMLSSLPNMNIVFAAATDEPIKTAIKKDTDTVTKYEDRADTEIIVRYKDDTKRNETKKRLKESLKLAKLDTKKNFPKSKIELLEVDAGQKLEDIVEALQKDPNVLYAQPNYKLAMNTTPTDKRFGEQWALLNIGQEIEGMPSRPGVDTNAVNAWDITMGSTNVVVGVLDTGIDINHNDLESNIYTNTQEIPGNNVDDDNNGYIDDVNGWDFANADQTVYDSSEVDFHGTYVAGIIAAKSDTEGIIGIAPNIKILPLKFINGQTGYTCDAIEAIEYAMQMNVKIINCSFGGTDNNLALKDAMQNSGILFVVAAGNRGGDIYSLPVYPAAFDLPNILAVAAIDNYGVLAPFSTYGNLIHVAAPGVNILSTTPENTYGYFSGTSVSAPFVTGIAALVKSQLPNSTILEVSDRIKNNVVDSISLQDKISTGGRVDAYAALTNVKPAADTYSGPGSVVVTIPAGDQGGETDTWYTMDQLSTIKEKLHYGESGVNPASGNFSFTATDMSVPAPGFEVNLSRTYNSRDNKATPLGKGWTFGFEGSAKGIDLVTVSLPNGSVQRFRKDGTLYKAEDSRSIFVKNADNTYTLTTKDQYTYGFNTDGWLVWMKDRNGNTVNIQVDTLGKVQKITDTVNREFIVTYNAQGLIDNIKDPEDRVVKYEYDVTGHLIRVTDPAGTYMRYSYDSVGYLNKIEDHYLKTIEMLTYNNTVGVDQGKVVQATDSNGNINNYSYDTLNKQTTIKDQNGRTWTYWFDNDMYTIKVQDAENKVSLTEYFLTGGKNIYGDVKSTTDRNGNKTQYEIDDRGNVTKITNPDFSCKEFGYDDKNNKIWQKDEQGKFTFYTYDDNKINQLKKTQPLNGTDQYTTLADQTKFAITQYEYYTKLEAQTLFNCYADGLIKSITDPEGNITEYTYDTYGNIKTVKDPEGKITTDTYNKIGWRLNTTSPNGYITEYTYDLNGLTEKVVQNNGETTRIVYDMAGRKIKEVAPNQYDATLDDIAAHSYSGDSGYRYEYYDTGLLKKSIDPLNYETIYTYDVYGNIVTETKPNGAVYRYEYDVMNRITKSYFKESATAQELLLEEYSYAILTDGKTQKTYKQYLNDTEVAETIYVYDYAQRPVEQQNPDGSKSKLCYSTNGTLSTSTAPNGSITYYKYDSLDRLVEKYTPFEIVNGSTQYSYERFDYDKAGRKIAVHSSKDLTGLNIQPLSLITTSYTYYNNGLLKSEVDSEGRRSDYTYDNAGNLAKEEQYIDAVNKKIIEYTYNHFNKPIEKKEHVSAGALIGNEATSTADTILATTYAYDKNGNIKTVTNPQNVVTTYEYDNMNRQISMSQPGLDEFGTEAIITNTTTYNWEGKPLIKTDANGNITSYEYDNRGQQIRAIDAKGGVSAYSYDRAGRMVIEVLPLNYDALKSLDQQNRVEYIYDIMGRVKAKKDIYYDTTTLQWKTIYTSSYKYDINGNVIKELDALGYEAGTGVSIEERISTGYGTKYTYNLANKLVSTIDPVSQERELSYTNSYKYDGLGRKIAETNAKGVVTLYNYDNVGNILSIKIKKSSTAPEQIIKQAAYDLLSRQKTQVDGNGNITYFEYNELDKISKVIYPGDETIEANTITYQYDLSGNLAKQQDSLGKVSLYTYDKQNRMLSETEQKSDGSEAISLTVKYDKNGNTRFETDGNGAIKEYTYDNLNRLKTTKITVNGVPQVTTYDYDANGNQTTVTDWKGNISTNVYDSMNRLIEKKDPYTTIQRLEYNNNSIQVKSYDALGSITEYQYDKNNRLTKTIDASGHSTSQSYDDVGNISTKTDGRNITTTYNYDELNRLKSVVNAKLEATSYTYDLNGNLLTQTDGNGNTTIYEYNIRNIAKKKIDNDGRLGLPSSFTYINGKVESYTYNADGSINTMTDRKGVVTSYIYDIHGRLMSRSTGSQTISYTYDSNSNQLTMTDSTGTTTRTYDELNRTTTKNVPSIGMNTYVYDITANVAAGNIKETSTDAKGNTVEKVYDKTGRLAFVISADGTTIYTYYDNGNTKSVEYPNGVKEEYTYYEDNLLKTLVNKKADGSIIDSYAYTYDAAHNQTSKADAKGTTSYTYDSLNRLEKVVEPDGKTTTYTFDKAGNRLTETIAIAETVTAMTNYTYDEQNRLTTTVTVKGNGLSEKVTYNYDDNGNMISKFKVTLNLAEPNLLGAFEIFKAGESEDNSVSFYEYNELNQLVKTTEGNMNISYAYNGEGYRVQKSINGQVVNYLYEGDRVVLETDGTGAQTAANVYGTNLVSRTADSETAYYLYNGHADVVALLSTTGSTLASYYYDAFGNATETTGTIENPYRYAGYRYDEETDVYYLNARYYDAKIARFMTEDTYRGQIDDPLSLNLYTYCHNEPLMYWDPTGHYDASLYQEAGAGYSAYGEFVTGPKNTQVNLTAGKVLTSVTSTFISFTSGKLLGGINTTTTTVNTVKMVINDPKKATDDFKQAVTNTVTTIVDVCTNPTEVIKGVVDSVKQTVNDKIINGDAESRTEVVTGLILNGLWELATGSIANTVDNVVDSYKVVDKVADTTHIVKKADKASEIIYTESGLIKVTNRLDDVPKVTSTHLPTVTAGDNIGINLRPKTVNDVLAEAGDVVSSTVKKPIIIGENMKRVQKYADEVGGHAYNPWKNDPFDFDLGMKRNKRWINDMMKEGREIIDIGPDFMERSMGIRKPSKFYGMERQQVKGYENYTRMFERDAKFSGGVLGLDR